MFVTYILSNTTRVGVVNAIRKRVAPLRVSYHVSGIVHNTVHNTVHTHTQHQVQHTTHTHTHTHTAHTGRTHRTTIVLHIVTHTDTTHDTTRHTAHNVPRTCAHVAIPNSRIIWMFPHVPNPKVETFKRKDKTKPPWVKRNGFPF